MQQTRVDDRYSIVGLLGSGGMAKVYLAHDEVLGRDVALKVLREHYAEDEEFVERFEQEARNAASLSHPNIVPVYDRGEAEDGTRYISMEYLPGGTLGDHLRKSGPLDPDTAARVEAQIAEALGAAHEKGVVHRDVKPQNVLLTASGDVKVADFGIARAASAKTRTSVVLGTASYMSPEQAMGRPVGPASDLYSLGVVFYEMLTGEPPFDGDGPITVSLKHINEPPRPPIEIDPNIPGGTNAIVMKLLAKRPEDRHADAAELVGDLERVRDGLPLAAAGVASAGASANRTRTVDEVVPGAPAERTGRTRVPPSASGPARGRRRRRRVTPFLLAALVAVPVLLGALALERQGGFLQGALGPGATNGWFDGPREVLRQADRATGAGQAEQAEVPDVEGLTRIAAEQRLTAAGLEVGVVAEVSSDNVPAGKVIAPGYPTGTALDPGTAVNLTVSSGPQQPANPAISGATTEAAPEPTVPAQPAPVTQPAPTQPTPEETVPAPVTQPAPATPSQTQPSPRPTPQEEPQAPTPEQPPAPQQQAPEQSAQQPVQVPTPEQPPAPRPTPRPTPQATPATPAQPSHDEGGAEDVGDGESEGETEDGEG